jgi:transcription termination/antitermination protein NusA
MDSQNFISAINQVCGEKKISREAVLETAKEAIKTAYRKDFGNRDQNLEVILDPNSGRATVLLVKTVVEDDKLENKHAEISQTDVRRIKKDIKLGAKIKIDVTPLDFGRIASQSAKQVIVQKIREAEQKTIYEEYAERADELLNAIVHRIEPKCIHLELNRTTTILENRNQIPRERYQQGQRLKVYLEKAEMTTRGPILHVSRTHPRFIFRLMELEIPEVRNGAVIVKAIAREAGVRCKIIVDSIEENVDPVGACVGQRGVRIQNITDEVNGERIDVIEWSEDFDTLLKECLSPAKIDKIIKYEDEKRVEVFVEEDQRALAIGKNGQNVRLSADVMGWEIDILNTVELSEKIDLEEEKQPATKISNSKETENKSKNETSENDPEKDKKTKKQKEEIENKSNTKISQAEKTENNEIETDENNDLEKEKNTKEKKSDTEKIEKKSK